MADRTPQVGDPAMLDGIELTVFSVEPDRIHFADADAAACATRVAEIRAKHQAAGDELAARWEQWKTDVAAAEDRAAESANNATRAKLALEEDVYRTQLQAELDAVPRGTRIGIHPSDVVWMENERAVVGYDGKGFVFQNVSAWSVPGRLSPDSVASGNKLVKVPKEIRRQDHITKAHRAAKSVASKEG